jgi:hypothetical protein
MRATQAMILFGCVLSAALFAGERQASGTAPGSAVPSVTDAGPPEGPPLTIVITEQDLRPRELARMRARKQELLRRANALAASAKTTSNSLSYAREYLLYESELADARRLKWWDETETVTLPTLSGPSDSALEELARRHAVEKQRIEEREAALREERRKQQELALKRDQFEEQARQGRVQLQQKDAELRELRRQNEILEERLYWYYPAIQRFPLYPPPVNAPKPRPAPGTILFDSPAQAPGTRAGLLSEPTPKAEPTLKP